MEKKVMYAVGDSFTFGDELLNSVKKTNSMLANTGQQQFNLEVLNHIHQKSPTLHDEIIKLKNMKGVNNKTQIHQLKKNQ